MEQRAGFAEIGGLQLVIGFQRKPTLQIFELVFRVLPIFCEPGGKHEQKQVAEIRLNSAGDAGVLNFHGDLFAGLKPRSVDLPQRRGGERLFLK